MTRKCANPECDAKFLYSNRGRLFSFELRRPIGPCRDVPPAICEKKPSHAVVHFWLCERCASKMTVHFDQKNGLSIISLPKGGVSESQPKTGRNLAGTRRRDSIPVNWQISA